MTETTDSTRIDTLPPSHGGLIARLQALRHHKEFRRFSKFAVVGALGFLIDAGTFNLMLALGWFSGAQVRLPFDLATVSEVGVVGAISFVLAITSNFIWNRFWTYPDSRSKSVVGQLITFFLVNTAGLVIRIPILEWLSRPLARLVEQVIPSLNGETIGANAALIVAVIIVMFWNFFVNRYWTYNDVD